MKTPSIFLLLGLLSCQITPENSAQLNLPEVFLIDLIPDGQLAHAGVFSPDKSHYYLTLSDTAFQRFDILEAIWDGNAWTAMGPAMFNSEFNDHGLGFSADGQELFFSSTRPTGIEGVPNTWHIWRCAKAGDSWSKPTFVAIPGLENKLVSHPSLTKSGRLYFHAGELDYSHLSLYYTDPLNGNFQPAKKVTFSDQSNVMCFTPFVSTNESYLLLAKIIDGKEALLVSHNKNNIWQSPIKLNDAINESNKGNPFVCADEQFLYFASAAQNAETSSENWVIKRVGIDAIR